MYSMTVPGLLPLWAGLGESGIDTSRIPFYCSVRMLEGLIKSENLGSKNCYIFAFLIRNLLNGKRSLKFSENNSS